MWKIIYNGLDLKKQEYNYKRSKQKHGILPLFSRYNSIIRKSSPVIARDTKASPRKDTPIYIICNVSFPIVHVSQQFLQVYTFFTTMLNTLVLLPSFITFFRQTMN